VTDEAQNLALVMLREMRAQMATNYDIARLDGKIDNLGVDLRGEIKSLRADVASDILSLHTKIDSTRKGSWAIRSSACAAP
jgi:hypothetical protein